MVDEAKNGLLFSIPEDWKAIWRGMPDFEQRNLEPSRSMLVHFASVADRDAFSALIGTKLTDDTRSVWYPKAEIGHYADRRYATPKPVDPKYPIYVISKGRWESRLTSRALEKIGVPYRIVVEPQEHASYANVVDPAKVLTLPFSNLGQGSIPARNWVWEHALSEGASRHWILDDNIGGFYRLHRNLKTPVGSGAIFRAAEDFSDRYSNVAISGFNYFMFASRKSPAIKPFTLNTRIYSCILIRNDVAHRWRGRYNEDTDLSLRILKDGNCSVLFNAFLAGKSQTMSMKGGNTDELYAGTESKLKEWEAHRLNCDACKADKPQLCDVAKALLYSDGRWKMALSLWEQHPDLTTVTRKWDRWQHHVDYSVFRRNKLVMKPGVNLPSLPNDYGMELEILTAEEPREDFAAVQVEENEFTFDPDAEESS